VNMRPFSARTEVDRLECMAKASARISEGDMMNRSVRMRQNWQGPADIARHVIDTHFEPRFLCQIASYDVASNICQALGAGA